MEHEEKIIIAGVIGIFAILLFVIVSDNKTCKGGQIAEYQKENFADDIVRDAKRSVELVKNGVN